MNVNKIYSNNKLRNLSGTVFAAFWFIFLIAILQNLLIQKFNFVKCFVKHGKIYLGIVFKLKVSMNPVLAVES
jgi:hypothetical protein